MADLSISNTFVPNTVIVSADVNTNFSDIVNFINNRNHGSTSWTQVATSGQATIGTDLTVNGLLHNVGAVTFDSTLLVSNDATFNSGFTILAPGNTTLTVSSGSSSTYGSLVFQLAGITQGFMGVEGISGGLVTGDSSGDLFIRADTGNILMSPDAGATIQFKLAPTGIATFFGQLIGKGTATSDNASAGYIGEVSSSSITSFANYTVGSTHWQDITSIPLSAGDWDISCNGAVSISTGSCTSYQVAATNHVGDTGSGVNVGQNSVASTLVGVSTAASQSFTFRVSLAAPTTYYLKMFIVVASGTQQVAGTIYARRAR